ncbi:MAG: ATP synthase subunit I [Clostridia bacterium]|nr:ATP synthase subunit I [Clostridia bacterium]
MNKNNSVIIRESMYIAVWVILLSCLMEAVFLIIGLWDCTVLLGNLLSGVVAVLNFYLMGITVEKAIIKEEKDASNFMRLSQTARMLMTFAAVAVGVLLPYFHIVSLLLPLFFPRIAIIFRPLFPQLDEEQTKSASDGGDDQ